ncbi:MAG TPA: YCF48-related protein [Pyrinomonadaceae bacterium]|jgi:photosystem II stability/assembly factor-like uncharacterized protein
MKSRIKKQITFKIGFLLAMAFMLLTGVAPLMAEKTGNNVITDPDKFSSWEVVGPSGGDVRVVAIDPKDKNRLYISTLDGQIHTSYDGGKSWRLLVNLNRPQLVLDQLMVDSQDSNLIYASGHRHTSPGGFFKSKDGGLTWSEANELKKASIHSMTQSTADPKVLLVGTTEGIWISKNSGDDWEKISSSTMPVNIGSLAVDPRNLNTIYAGTWWRAYKSTDSGKNWRLIKNGMIDDSDVFAITIDSRDPNHIIASACSGIYESFNGGEKWAKIQGIPAQSRRTRDILQHPTIPGTVYAATTEGFWMTTNGGKNWSLTTRRDLEINSIAVHPDEPNRVYIGTNNYGVMVSNDGGKNFVPTNDNFSSRFTYSVTLDRENPTRMYATTHNTATGGGFVFTSADSGRSWQQAKNLDINQVSPYAVLQDRNNPNNLYLGTNLGIFQSVDRGVNWTLIAPPKPKTTAKKPVRKAVKGKTTAAKAKTVKPVETAKAPETAASDNKPVIAFTEKVKVLTYTEDGKNGIFAGTDKGLYRTYDMTKGWEKISFGEGIDENVFVVYSTPLQPETIWVGTATSGVIVSRDNGKTWQKAGGAPENFPISSIAVDPKRPEYVYVGTSQTLYLSRDGGKTWTRRGGNLPLGNYTSILVNPRNSDEIFVSSALETDGGIFFSDNAGMNWKRVDSKNMKVPSRRVWAMTFDPNDSNRIYAGSHSSGVYVIERKGETAGSDNLTRPRVAAAGN